MIEKITEYKNMASGNNFCALAIEKTNFTRATGFGKTEEEAAENAEANLFQKNHKKGGAKNKNGKPKK